MANDFTCARILYHFRCILPSKNEYDIALVRLFKRSAFTPRTKWAGCEVFERERHAQFVMVNYFIRGVHMIDVVGATRGEGKAYLNDMVDNDMFLRRGN